MTFRFILNPISGNRSIDPEYIKEQVTSVFGKVDFQVTQRPGHATELAQEAVEKEFGAVIAIGGDGTINETAKGLLHSKTALGIVPIGSGNGFAREIGMSTTLEQALNQLRTAVVQWCDVGFANGELFLNVAGVGIEAVVAWKFMEQAQSGTRGMLPYFKLAAQTFFNYKPPMIRVMLNGKTHRWAPLTLAFANNRQYGNHFVIAPKAGIADGKLDMVIVSNLPKYKVIAALPFFFMGQIPPFNLTATAQLQSAVVESDQPILYHIDGEPRKTARHLEITMTAHALRLMVP